MSNAMGLLYRETCKTPTNGLCTQQDKGLHTLMGEFAGDFSHDFG